jgi:HK97 family phage major capsid protein
MEGNKMLDSATVTLIEELEVRKLAMRAGARPVSRNQLLRAVEPMVRSVLDRVAARESKLLSAVGAKGNAISRMLNGICAMRGAALDPKTAEADVAFLRSISTGATPGSYLVPVIQANAIIGQLAQYSTARAAGARIWPMAGLQFMNVPGAIAAPSFVWMAQNSKQTPSDGNYMSMAFDLKNQQAFIVMPMQLFRAAVPAWDVIFEDSFALGLAESEDLALHASATLTGAPTALMSQSGITIINAAGNGANGGNLAYSDLLALLQKAIDLKVKPPYCWLLNGRTALRALTLYDTTSRPIWIPGPEGVGPQIGHLLGFPVYASSSIATNEAVGSGSNQSHLIFTNPRSIHIAESGDIEMSVSTDFGFDVAQIALRVGHKIAFGYNPPASIIVLAGIN